MKNIIACTTIIFALSACGGGSSNDTTSMTNITGIPTNDEGTTTGDNTNSATESTDAAASTAGSTGNTNEATTTAGTATGGITDNTESSTDGGVNGGNPSSNINQFGIVTVESEGLVYFSASFFSVPQQVPFSLLQENIRPTADLCEVSSLDLSGDTSDVLSGFDDLNITGISAGDVLTISSPAGSYAELLKNEQFGFIYYELDENVILSSPVPSNLTLNIPGEQFPAFSNVAIPFSEPLQVNSPNAFEPITASTAFSWVPSDNPNAFIDISASAISADFTGFTTVNCTVIDDGSFAFPATTQSQMGAFSAISAVSRTTINTQQNGNAVLFLASTVEQTN